MDIRFVPSSETISANDFVEVTILTGKPVSRPFSDVTVTGVCRGSASEPFTVDGFCDSQDGSVYRVRFLATAPGDYAYTVTIRLPDGTEATHEGRFAATPSDSKGLLRVDPEHPWHFLWQGTGEHFFWNATTAYHMSGLREDVIDASIERLASLGVNRVRVALSPARVPSGETWYEPTVVPDDAMTFLYGPWLAARPEDVDDPGWDVTRYDIGYWRRFEHLLRTARRHDVVVSVIFYLDGARAGAYPFPRDEFGGNADEERYYQYAIARFAAFTNVTWDVTNEWKLFRNDPWVETMGAYIAAHDAYGHLTSVHGHGDFPFRKSEWADYALFQSWDEHGAYAFMSKNRQEQAETGRPIPQINDEYGYEDHYPGPWGEGRVAPARAADTRRRHAWEITMAGCYQTTGESSANGLGGWLNGRGDASMTMLEGYKLLKEFFTAFPWWRLEPHSELAGGAMCLAEPGQRYVVYLPQGGSARIDLSPGHYHANWYNPRNGSFTPIAEIEGGAAWESPAAADGEDWVLVVAA